MAMKNGKFLHSLLSAVTDTEGMDASEIGAELKALGVKVESEQKLFDSFLEDCAAAQRRLQLDAARDARTRNKPLDLRQRVRDFKLTIDQLRERLKLEGAPVAAYRDLDPDSDERGLLEQHLADILALKESKAD